MTAQWACLSAWRGAGLCQWDALLDGRAAIVLGVGGSWAILHSRIWAR